ncbi:hypothetical protein SAY87_002594 [Trapa incisa]|uniref:Polygalacturonase n=2 Tax=Trapa TaxID=22665 RepID=A0AAN7KCQ8_TRANT|nr:hypothetical protein SAY87_002594 [Trapa incisa]KAK4764739.1 hypothetical protein SAY86_025829 [Trapa natans]
MAARSILSLTYLALSIICIATSWLLTATSAAVYDVVSMGAKADGSTDSSQAFLSAWTAACASSNPSTITIPSGNFYVKSVAFEGPCKSGSITFKIDGTLVASSDYAIIGSSGNWIIFRQVDGLNVYGGFLNGQGSSLWACKAAGKSCPEGATNLEFSNSKNILVSGLSSVNSQMFHIVVNECQNVKLQGIRVSALGDSPNTDGIHVSQSTGVTIQNSKIGTGDDCISIGPGTADVWIEKVDCGPGHGISIGSLGKDTEEDGVQNVTVSSATFSGTQNGVRIKSWARPSTGFARNILFQHVGMNNVQNPIIIDQNYCPSGSSCPDSGSSIRINDVTYQDIHGTSATEVALKFDCNPKSPCTGITMEDVNLTYQSRAAEASCKNVGGTASGLIQPSGCL